MEYREKRLKRKNTELLEENISLKKELDEVYKQLEDLQIEEEEEDNNTFSDDFFELKEQWLEALQEVQVEKKEYKKLNRELLIMKKELVKVINKINK